MSFESTSTDPVVLRPARIDLNAVQNEDDISKVDLAKEIERTRQNFNSQIGELQTQIDQVLSRAKEIGLEIQRKNGAYMEQMDNKFKADLVTARQALEVGFQGRLEKELVSLNDYRRSIDQKFSEYDKSLEGKTRAQVDLFLSEVAAKNAKMEKDLSDFYKNAQDLMLKFQSQTLDRMLSLGKEFEEIKKKFSLVSDLLKK